MKLFFNAFIKFSLGIVLVGALIFLPAMTLDFFGGWLFMALLFIPMLIMGTVMFIKSPDLLKRRLDAKEEEGTQKSVVALSGLVFLLGFILSSFDFRYGWSSVPLWLVALASTLFLVGYGTYAEVMRENAYLSRTVKVSENQTVITDGLYAAVRHPMYLATLLMFLPIPLILGSFWGLVPFGFYLPIIAARILSEEKLLTAELPGYEEYKNKTKYRLIPFIW